MPITGNVLSLLQTDTGRVLAGTGGNFGHIYHSDDDGVTWTAGVALGDATTRVNALTKDRNGNIFAAVSHSTNPNFNGIWKGVNHGSLWSKVKSHPNGLGYYDITAIQSFRLVAVGPGVTDGANHSPIIISNDAGATWQNAPQQHFGHPYKAVAAAPDPVLGTVYPNDPVTVNPAFYGSDTYFTGAGRVGLTGFSGSTPVAQTFNMVTGQMGNGGLDMTAFLIKDSGGNYRHKALWAVKQWNNTSNTEVWGFPASPTGPYTFVKLATIPGKIFNVLYTDPIANWQNIGAQRTVWAGADGEIWVSYNSGLTWQLSTTAPVNQVYSFVRTSSGVLIAGGANGEIYRASGTTGGGNTAPVAHTQTVNAISGVPKAITLTATDAQGDPLTYTVWTNPTHGTLTGTAPNLTYTASPGYVGPDSLLFQVYDGKLYSTAVQVYINVTAAPPPANTAPTANSQTVVTSIGIAKAITLTGSDPDGQTLTYSIVASPANGVLSGTGDSRTYTPNAGFAGFDSFTFKVNDGIADSNVATVSILVEFLPSSAVLGSGESTAHDEVYVGNKMALSNITHVVHYNGSSYQNLQFFTEPPYYLLGETLAVGKAVYFGSQTSNAEVPGGTFANIIFNLSQTMQNATVVWEYWNGSAWTALTLHDNSSGFQLEGSRSVHWHPPATWATTTVHGVTGYWVRARVSAVSAGSRPPIHDGNFIYTVLLPYVEVSDEAVGGDLPAVARIRWQNRADDPASTLAMEADRIVCGLRTLERGLNFQAYLNVSDVQAPFGVTVTAGVASSWSTVKAAPTTRALTIAYSSAPQLSVWNNLVTFTLANTVARDYYGNYRAFVRAFKSTGSDNVWQVRIRTTFGSGGSSVDSKVVFPSSIADWEVLDLGQISIPTTQVAQQSGNLGDEMSISIQGKCSALSSSLTLYDLILIPVDEWAVDARPPRVAVSMASQIKSTNFLDIDSVSNPKANLLVLNRNEANQIVSRYQALSNGPAMLQSGRDQRLWFFAMATTGTYWYAYPALAGTIQIFKQQRYLGLRGTS